MMISNVVNIEQFKLFLRAELNIKDNFLGSSEDINHTCDIVPEIHFTDDERKKMVARLSEILSPKL